MRKKVILLMPLSYNDGTPVPDAVLDLAYSELYRFSDGITFAGKVRGAFRMADGTRHEDFLEQVWVAVTQDKLPALRELVSRIGNALHQERMYFEITDASVELLPPLPEEG